MDILTQVHLFWRKKDYYLYLTDRWSFIGFVGAGQAYNDSWAGNSDVVIGRGVGVRYMLARALGMMVGLDIAQGPDDTAFYIVIGGDWSIR